MAEGKLMTFLAVVLLLVADDLIFNFLCLVISTTEWFEVVRCNGDVTARPAQLIPDLT
jgi:hypothetical protein